MSDRKKVELAGTLQQFIGRGLCPCDGCLREARGFNDTPILSRRVYYSGDEDQVQMGTRTCTGCGFFVFTNGAFGTTIDLSRHMCGLKTETNSGGLDATADVSPRLPTEGGLLMRHSDSKTSFSTGAQRDTTEGKGSPSLISPVLIHRLGVLLQKGAEHYGADNWTKGMPFRRTADSMIRHMYQWLAGDKEEDHLAAVCFGAMCLMHYESAELPETEGLHPMDDRCKNNVEILASILTSPKPEPILKTDADFGNEDQSSSGKKLCKGGCGVTVFFGQGTCANCERG